MSGDSSDSPDGRQQPVGEETGHELGDRGQPDEYEQFVDFFENAAVPMHWVGPDGTVLHANQAELDALGYAREEYVGRHIADFHADQEVIDDILNRLSSDEELRDYEARMLRKDGSVRHVLIDSCVNWEDGEFVNTRCVTRDITERKQYERELQRYRTLVETVGDPMYILDTDGHLETVNQAMAELGGTSREDLVGRHVSEFLADGDTERGNDLIRGLLVQSDRQWGTFEVTIEPATGDPFPAEVNLGLIKDDDDNYVGNAGVIHDLTEHKARERQLQRQNERLDEFAGIVTHDLRNPLSVAVTRLELAREEADSEHLQAVSRAHDRIEALIADVLTLAKAGDSVPETEAVDLSDLCRRCWETVATGDASLNCETDLVMRADESRLRQLLENLIRNAVEHVGAGVTITVGKLDDGFFVEDDGPGIPAGDREKIFETGYTSSAEGTGFGLNIVKRVADSHGWDVTVTEGGMGGARFEFSGA